MDGDARLSKDPNCIRQLCRDMLRLDLEAWPDWQFDTPEAEACHKHSEILKGKGAPRLGEYGEFRVSHGSSSLARVVRGPLWSLL